MAEEKKYYIKLQGELIEVSKEVYLAYYRMERSARVVVEKDQRNGTVLFSDLDTQEFLTAEMFQDQDAVPVEEIVIGSVMKEKLRQCLQTLPQQEHTE